MRPRTSLRPPLFAAALLVTTATAATAAPVAYDDHLIAIEEVTLQFEGEQLTLNDDLDGAAVEDISIAQEPGAGTLEKGPATFNGGPLFSYTPDPGFTGYDLFTYRLELDTGVLLEADVHLWVSPLTVPLAGDWDGDGEEDLGWFHAQRSELFFFTFRREPAAGPWTANDPTCARLPSGLKSTGWIPIAGDWDGDGDDDPGAFDPAGQRVHLFVPGKRAELQPYATLSLPVDATRSLPVVGNWDGLDSAPDRVGLYFPDNGRFVLLDHQQPTPAILADFTFVAGAGEWLPVAGDWDSDTIASTALWDSVARVLLARNANTSGGAEISVVYEQGQPTAHLPVAGDWGGGESIAFYEQGPPPRFILYPYDLPSIIGGSAIVLPPPEDPVVTVCDAP